MTELGWEESEWTALGGGHNGANFNNDQKKIGDRQKPTEDIQIGSYELV